MPPAVPAIYNHNFPAPPLTHAARIIAAALALAALATLLLAMWLEPDRAGVGTHRQIGLAPCGLLLTTGVPCMTCGMTTSFAHFAHAQVLTSLWVQPAGTVLAFVAACLVWAGGYIAFTGLPGALLLNRMPWVRLLLTLLAVLLLAWTWKVFVHVRGSERPPRVSAFESSIGFSPYNRA